MKNDDFANKRQFELKSYVIMIVDEKSWQFSLKVKSACILLY